MPVTRDICPHAWTSTGDVTRSVNEANGQTRTHTFSIFTCSICGLVLERENEINVP